MFSSFFLKEKGSEKELEIRFVRTAIPTFPHGYKRPA